MIFKNIIKYILLISISNILIILLLISIIDKNLLIKYIIEKQGYSLDYKYSKNKINIKNIIIKKSKIIDSIDIEFNYNNKILEIKKLNMKNINEKNILKLIKNNNLLNNKNNKLITKILYFFIKKIKINNINIKSKNNIIKNTQINNIEIKITKNNIYLTKDIKINTILNINKDIKNIKIKTLIDKKFKINIKLINDYINADINIIKNNIFFNIKIEHLKKYLNKINEKIDFLKKEILIPNINIKGEYNIIKNLFTKIKINQNKIKEKKYIIQNLLIKINYINLKTKEMGINKINFNLFSNNIYLKNKKIKINEKLELLFDNKNFKIILSKKSIKLILNDFIFKENFLNLKGFVNFNLVYKYYENNIKINLFSKKLKIEINEDNEKLLTKKLLKNEKKYSSLLKIKTNKTLKENKNLELLFFIKINKLILKTKNFKTNQKINLKIKNKNKFTEITGSIKNINGIFLLNTNKITIKDSDILLKDDGEFNPMLNIYIEKIIDNTEIYGKITGYYSNPKLELNSNKNLTKNEIILLLVKNKQILEMFQKIKENENKKKINIQSQSGIFIFNLMKEELLKKIGINFDKLILESEINELTNEENIKLNIEKKITKKILLKYEQFGNEYKEINLKYKIKKRINFEFEYIEENEEKHQGFFITYEN